jgi:hypothetical protein
MNRRVVVLNELAQGVWPLAEGVTWFERSDADEQFRILCSLALYCDQADPIAKDARQSVRAAGLDPTDAPAVLIAQRCDEQQLVKIIRLPESEWTKAFRLLVTLFRMADTRRRQRSCAAGCLHAWHHLGYATDTPWPAATRHN